jgi:CRISPR system Cascade subunit CasA
LFRGLFWQPAKIELLWNESGECIGFNKEKFNYTVEGFWQHPHSPFIINLKQKKQYYMSFRSTAPAWTYLNQFLIRHEDQNEPALVLTQYRGLYPAKKLKLIAGGYKNKQASIIQRRHELLSLAHGWDNNMDNVEGLIELALDTKDVLKRAVKQFLYHAELKKINLDAIAEQHFYLASEEIIYKRLEALDYQAIRRERLAFFNELSVIVKSIFYEVIQPYQNITQPKLINAFAKSERTLNFALRELKPETEETIDA